MRKLAFGALMIGLLSAVAACGGGNGGDDVVLIDGSAIDTPSGVCDPIAQTGCATGEKCTWITIDSTNDLGNLGCAPDGAAATGEACTQGADGQTTGFDTCVHGDICINGSCEAVCTVSPDSCDSSTSCSVYTGLFTGASPALGACDFLCDPVTQIDTANHPACDSPDAANPTRGCYLSQGDFSCAGIPSGAVGKTQDMQAFGPDATHAYANGCDAGYIPLISDPTMAFPVCIAMCSPHTTSTADTTQPGGVSPHTCGDRGAVGADCRFFWPFEQANPPVYQNVGWCYSYTLYSDVSCSTMDPTVDMIGGGTNGDQPDGTPDYIQQLCAAFGTTLQGHSVKPMLKMPFHPAANLQLQR